MSKYHYTFANGNGLWVTLKINTSEQQVWFCSDPHYYHKNIIKYCNRPFDNIDSMNETLINNWNGCVNEHDVIFCLGDFCFGNTKKWQDILSKLNGKKYLILGNHDEESFKEDFLCNFEVVCYGMHIYVDGQSIYLSHYPFLCFPGSYNNNKPTWQLFGHVHSKNHKTFYEKIKDLEIRKILVGDESRLRYLLPSQYDVGVDANDYKPVNFFNLKKKIDYQIKHNINQYDISNKSFKYFFVKFITFFTGE